MMMMMITQDGDDDDTLTKVTVTQSYDTFQALYT